jgi:phenylacetate-CoA ligase
LPRAARARRSPAALEAWQELPLTNRDQLADGLVARDQLRYVRVSLTHGVDGPALAWFDTAEDLASRASLWRRALEAGGVTAADRVLLGLPGYSAIGLDCLAATIEVGALSFGSAGVSFEDVLRFEPSVLVCTPTDALRLAQTAADRRVDLADRPLRLLVVTGEPGGSIGSTRRRMEDAFGAHCLDVYALTEAGVVGWGCQLGSSIHLDDRYFACTAIQPDTEERVEDGEVGELVLTTLSSRSTPLARYRTGDLVQLSHTLCACGRSTTRAEGGVLGRVSERLLVRGVKLLPSTVEQVVRRHPAVAEYHLVVRQVGGETQLAVQLEADQAIASEGDRARVAAEVSEDLRRSLGLRVPCDVVAPSRLSNQDGGRRARRLSRQ